MLRSIMFGGGGLILGFFLGMAVFMTSSPRQPTPVPARPSPPTPAHSPASATETPADEPADEPRRANFTIYTLDVPWDANEATWAEALAKRVQGETEFRVKRGRVDVLTDRHAIEVDWLDKWHESVGQALHYAHETDRQPVIALASRTYVLSNEQKQFAFWLDRMLHKHDIDVWFLVVRRDNLGPGTLDVPGPVK